MPPKTLLAALAALAALLCCGAAAAPSLAALLAQHRRLYERSAEQEQVSLALDDAAARWGGADGAVLHAAVSAAEAARGAALKMVLQRGEAEHTTSAHVLAQHEWIERPVAALAARVAEGSVLAAREDGPWVCVEAATPSWQLLTPRQVFRGRGSLWFFGENSSIFSKNRRAHARLQLTSITATAGRRFTPPSTSDSGARRRR